MSAERTRRVLIVDDNDVVAEVIPHLLGPGFQTVRAVNGEEARALLVAGSVFDAVICDILMPHLDGLRLLEWAREHVPELVPRFVFLTVAPEFPAARELAQTHAVLRKPCTRAVLLAAMRVPDAKRKPCKMSDYDQEGVNAMARVLLEASIELRKEASQLEPSEREQDQLTKFAMLEKIRRDNPVHADAIRGRLLDLARENGEEFAAWLADLFERFRKQA